MFKGHHSDSTNLIRCIFCFRWEVEDWQVCSQSCGRGFRTRIVKCIIDKDGNKEQVMKFFILNYRLLFRNMKFMLDEMMFTFRILVFTSSKIVILLALMYYLHVFLQTSCSSEWFVTWIAFVIFTAFMNSLDMFL